MKLVAECERYSGLDPRRRQLAADMKDHVAVERIAGNRIGDTRGPAYNLPLNALAWRGVLTRHRSLNS
jgi:hypothetical protein